MESVSQTRKTKRMYLRGQPVDHHHHHHHHHHHPKWSRDNLRKFQALQYLPLLEKDILQSLLLKLILSRDVRDFISLFHPPVRLWATLILAAFVFMTLAQSCHFRLTSSLVLFTLETLLVFLEAMSLQYLFFPFLCNTFAKFSE